MGFGIGGAGERVERQHWGGNLRVSEGGRRRRVAE